MNIGKLDFDGMHNYRMAVTEREVINGVLTVDNVKDHVIVYTRIINNINLQNLKRASAFIDIADRKVDQEAVKLLATYRDGLLPKKMKDNNAIYKKYHIEWIGREGKKTSYGCMMKMYKILSINLCKNSLSICFILIDSTKFASSNGLFSRIGS